MNTTNSKNSIAAKHRRKRLQQHGLRGILIYVSPEDLKYLHQLAGDRRAPWFKPSAAIKLGEAKAPAGAADKAEASQPEKMP